MAEEKREPKVIPIVDEWFLGADNYCLILYRRTKVKGGGTGKQPKQENIGKENYVAVGYYTTLGGVLQAIVSAQMRESINRRGTKTLEDVWDDMRKFIDRAKLVDDKMVEKLKLKVSADG